MQVDIQRLEPCKVALNIQVPPEQITQTIDSVFNRFAKRTTVPGFRKGKAPRKLVERFIDADAVREAALDQVVQDAYKEALEETGIEPYDHPSVELKEFEEGQPFAFTATVPTRPEIELGDYKGIEVRRRVVPMGEEEVSRELQRVREQSARYEEVRLADSDSPEKPLTGAAEGDRVQCSIQISIDGEPLPEESHASAWMLVGTNFPEFDQNLQGILPGETREFDFTYPEQMQNEALSGKQAHAVITAERVQHRVVPAEDDEFAKSVGAENLEALRAQFRQQLEEAAQRQADDFVEQELLAEVVHRSTVNFPQSMVDEEVAHRVATLIKGLERRGLTMEDYLAHHRKSLTEVEEEYAAESRQILTNTLVLSRIAHDNDISVSDAEVTEELNQRAAAAGADPKVMRQVMQDQGEMSRLTNSVFIRKVMEYLKSVSVVKEAS